MSTTNPQNTPVSQRSTLVRGLLWTARILLVFALLGALLALIYGLGYHSYREVAKWAEPGSHDTLIYGEETYYLAGKASQKGVAKPKYPTDKILGRVYDDGIPVVTEPETTAETDPLPPDPEETETEEETDPPVESVSPPPGAQLFREDKHVYVIYSVQKQEDMLLVLEKDGEFYLYYREGTDNPMEKKK